MRTKRLTAYSFGHPRAAKKAEYLEVLPSELLSEAAGVDAVSIATDLSWWLVSSTLKTCSLVAVESSASTISNAAVRTFFAYCLLSVG